MSYQPTPTIPPTSKQGRQKKIDSEMEKSFSYSRVDDLLIKVQCKLTITLIKDLVIQNFKQTRGYKQIDSNLWSFIFTLNISLMQFLPAKRNSTTDRTKAIVTSNPLFPSFGLVVNLKIKS